MSKSSQTKIILRAIRYTIEYYLFWIPRRIGGFIFNYFVTFSPTTGRRGLIVACILMILGMIPNVLIEKGVIKSENILDIFEYIRIIICSISVTCAIVAFLKIIVTMKAYYEIIRRKNKNLPADEEGSALWDVSFWFARSGEVEMVIRNDSLIQEAYKRDKITFEIEEAICNRKQAYVKLRFNDEILMCTLPVGYIMDKTKFTLDVNSIHTYGRTDQKMGYMANCKLVSAEV